ncbi:MAG: DUF58 domain-containing protein [Phycisphaeraceae bacterium]
MTQRDPIDDYQGLYFAAKQLVDGLYTGRHASPLRGSGIEFHDYRPYTPGDDLRTIDWKLFGRTDRYYLKRYRRETDLNLIVCVDGSASMDFASLSRGNKQASLPTKYAVAQRLAAALATLAIRQGDRAGLGVFDRELRCLHPPTGSPRQLRSMLADLEHAEPSEGVADLAASLTQLAHTLAGRKAAIAVVGDLLDEPEPMLDALDRLRFAGHEVLVFQVLAPDERALPAETRGLRLIDPELGPAGRAINTRPHAIASSYQQLVRDHLEKVRRSLAARGIDHTLVTTDRPLIEPLRRYLAQRAARLS